MGVGNGNEPVEIEEKEYVRNEQPSKGSRKARKSERKKEPVAKKEVKVELRAKVPVTVKKDRAEPHIPVKIEIPEGAKFLTFSQLKEGHCKFELNGPDTSAIDFRFCGLSRKEGSQYCEYHHKFCSSHPKPPQPRKIPIPMRIR